MPLQGALLGSNLFFFLKIGQYSDQNERSYPYKLNAMKTVNVRH